MWSLPAEPFDNPYVAGDPVYPPLLAGRKDIFDRIGEVWSAKDDPDSIILYGHRRMGKSSILRNLDQVAPPGAVIVYADMAGETSFVESTADLLSGPGCPDHDAPSGVPIQTVSCPILTRRLMGQPLRPNSNSTA